MTAKQKTAAASISLRMTMALRVRRRAASTRPSSSKRYRLVPFLAFVGFLFLQMTLNKSALSNMQSVSLEAIPPAERTSNSQIKPSQEPTRHQSSAKIEDPHYGHLRYDWTNMTLTSSLAKRIEATMTNCSLPIGSSAMMNVNGLGGEMHIWSGKLCNAIEREWRLQTDPPWQWLDEALCGAASDRTSVMTCYFPKAEVRCPNDHLRTVNKTENKVPSPFITRCDSITKNKSKLISSFRAASMEYLFQSVDPAVVHEAERQLNLVFPQGKVPPDLITVHIRWGDKKAEMTLIHADDYVKAVKRILERRERNVNSAAHVFLATEDPKAVEAFREAAPNEWAIYVDQYFHDMLPYRNTTEDIYNQAPQSARESKGRAGLIAIASVLVAMEANDYVLTLASNWSRLMNELRKNVIDPRCGNCTNMIDLKFAEW